MCNNLQDRGGEGGEVEKRKGGEQCEMIFQ